VAQLTNFFCQNIVAGHEGPCLDAIEDAPLIEKTFYDEQYLFPGL